jgi:hypothetical protein
MPALFVNNLLIWSAGTFYIQTLCVIFLSDMAKQTYIKVAEFLTSSEAEAIKHSLRSNSIEFTFNGTGANYDETGGSVYYEISVSQDQYDKARRLIAINRKPAKGEVKCPHCGFTGYRTKPKKTIFQRLLYLGTELVECKKCKRNFGV